MSDDFQDQPPDKIHAADEVARRCIILYAVSAAGHKEPREKLVEWLQRENFWDWVSPKESAFLLSDSPTQLQYKNATWRAEALFALLWSLELIPELPSPIKLCNVQLIRSVLPPLCESASDFISSATLRSDSEILDANETIYQIHWRVRDAQMRDQPSPPGRLPRMPHPEQYPPVEVYNRSVVQERHYALNWLIGYCGQEWDEITTDT